MGIVIKPLKQTFNSTLTFKCCDRHMRQNLRYHFLQQKRTQNQIIYISFSHLLLVIIIGENQNNKISNQRGCGLVQL